MPPAVVGSRPRGRSFSDSEEVAFPGGGSAIPNESDFTDEY